MVTAPELGHSAQDNFMLNIMASFAEFERELIAARIADSPRPAEGAPPAFRGRHPVRLRLGSAYEAAGAKHERGDRGQVDVL